MFKPARPQRRQSARGRQVSYARPSAGAVPTMPPAVTPSHYATRRPRPRLLRFLVLAVVIIVLANILPGLLLAPHSTPRDQWRAGEMPELYQTDPAWARDPYSGGTIAEQGCGPATLAMARIRLTGSTDLGVAEMADWATKHGFSTDGSGSYWSLMTEGAAQLGLSSRELGRPTAQALIDELNTGRPVICIMGPGTFTSTGHFIALERVTEDGKVVIRDPNSSHNTRKTWDAELIANEAKAAWSLGVA